MRDLFSRSGTVASMNAHSVAGMPDAARMTPRQEVTFNELLAVGVPRPFAPPGLVEELRAAVEEGTRAAVSRWTESSLWLSKSSVMSVLRCEAGFRSSRESPRMPGKLASSVVGDITHRAIQLAYTHPGRLTSEYVQQALLACQASDQELGAFFAAASMAQQSDVMMQAASRLTAFMDSWPTIMPAWEPRFEEPLQAKVAGVTLAARMDLVLGRPRGDGRQSMLIADWKSGSLRDSHEREAGFHALVATLSYGVPPFRSTVYSLTSGTYTAPDVTPAMLRDAVGQVCAAATATVELLTGRREPQLRCGERWCQACGLEVAADAA